MPVRLCRYLVENPILTSPFQEPDRFWDFRQGQLVLGRGRRPAGYSLRPRLRGEQASLLETEVEVKDFETEQDRAKEAAARRWVRAVNHHGEFGRWGFRVCRDPLRLGSVIRDAAGAS